jgi:hypothetical protein
LTALPRQEMGVPLYRKVPWIVYRKGDSFIYIGVSRDSESAEPHRVAVFDADFAHGIIYHPARQEAAVRRLGLSSLTLFPTDQILIAQLLAARRGCYIHAAGAIMEGQGLLFVGHSDAGKSTATRMLKGQAEILCDDRIVVRRWAEAFKIHGTWSHGDIPDVSPNSAPLRAILFLEKSSQNYVRPLQEPKQIFLRLVGCLIRPLVSRDWWERSLELLEHICREVPCYDMHFDNSGNIVPVLKDLVANDLR